MSNGYVKDITMQVACTDKNQVVVYGATGSSATQYSKPAEMSCEDVFKIGVNQMGFLLFMVKNGGSQTFTLTVKTSSGNAALIGIIVGVVVLALLVGGFFFNKHRHHKLRLALH